MHIDMRVRWDEDSSLLAGLYMPFVSVNHQLFDDLNSELGREQLLFVPWRVHYFGVRFPPRGRTVDYILWDEVEKVILLVDDSECFPGTDCPRCYIIRVYWSLL